MLSGIHIFFFLLFGKESSCVLSSSLAFIDWISLVSQTLYCCGRENCVESYIVLMLVQMSFIFGKIEFFWYLFYYSLRSLFWDSSVRDRHYGAMCVCLCVYFLFCFSILTTISEYKVRLNSFATKLNAYFWEWQRCILFLKMPSDVRFMVNRSICS